MMAHWKAQVRMSHFSLKLVSETGSLEVWKSHTPLGVRLGLDLGHEIICMQLGLENVERGVEMCDDIAVQVESEVVVHPPVDSGNRNAFLTLLAAIIVRVAKAKLPVAPTEHTNA